MKSECEETELILAYLEFMTTNRPMSQICKERGVRTDIMYWWAIHLNSRINIINKLRRHLFLLRLQIDSQKKLFREFAAPSKN